MRVGNLKAILAAWPDDEEIYVGLIWRGSDMIESDYPEGTQLDLEAWSDAVRSIEKHYDSAEPYEIYEAYEMNIFRKGN
jgi:hypothetical protein